MNMNCLFFFLTDSRAATQGRMVSLHVTQKMGSSTCFKRFLSQERPFVLSKALGWEGSVGGWTAEGVPSVPPHPNPACHILNEEVLCGAT